MTRFWQLNKWWLLGLSLLAFFAFSWYKLGRIYNFQDWVRYEAAFYLEPLSWWTILVPACLILVASSIQNHRQYLIRAINRATIFQRRVLSALRQVSIFTLILAVIGTLRLWVLPMSHEEMFFFLFVWFWQLVTAWLSLTTLALCFLIGINYLNRVWPSLLITLLISVCMTQEDRLPWHFPWSYFDITGMLSTYPQGAVQIPYLMIFLWLVMILGLYLIGSASARRLRWLS